MQDYIRNAINSIQKQTLKDIEIVAVNDYSTDNSYNILKELALKDKRIKIINNTKNFGLLYSRAMGILHSSGEYLINLDPDDEFNDSDNLEYLYNITLRNKVDIITFETFYKKKNRILRFCKESNIIIEQPRLINSFFIYVDKHFNDILIWNKLIKKEIFLKAYKIFENYIYYKKWNYYEDNIWSLLVHKVSNSKICVDKLIYIYNNNLNKQSLMKNKANFIEFTNKIYLFEMKRKILNNIIYKKYLSHECNKLIAYINKSKNLKKYIESDILIRNKIIYNIKSCIKYYEISNNNKKIIVNLFKYIFDNYLIYV